MKNTIKRILIFALIAGMLIFPGCTQEPEEKAPSNHAQLHSLLGRSITEVCQTLGVDEAQVRLSLDGKAEMPSFGEAQYAGLTWATRPYFNQIKQIDENGSLYGFHYNIRYTENPDQSAPIFVDLVAALQEDYGEPKVTSDTFVWGEDLTAESILKYVWERKSFSANQTWYLDHEVTPEMQAYMNRLLAAYNQYSTPDEDERWALVGYDYILSVSYSAGLNSASITLTYQLIPRQDYVGPSQRERLEAQSQNTNSTQQTP